MIRNKTKRKTNIKKRRLSLNSTACSNLFKILCWKHCRVLCSVCVCLRSFLDVSLNSNRKKTNNNNEFLSLIRSFHSFSFFFLFPNSLMSFLVVVSYSFSSINANNSSNNNRESERDYTLTLNNLCIFSNDWSTHGK